MKENFKFWIYGNLLALTSSCAIIIVIILNDYYEFFKISSYYSFRIIAFCVPLFLAALIIKYIKKDLSVFLYTSLCFLYIIFANPLFKAFDYVAIVLYYNKAPGDLYIPHSFNLISFLMPPPAGLTFCFILSSFLGGAVVDIYKYFKGDSRFVEKENNFS